MWQEGNMAQWPAQCLDFVLSGLRMALGFVAAADLKQ